MRFTLSLMVALWGVTTLYAATPSPALCDCKADEYCQTAPGHCMDVGQCTTKPSICTKEYQPVCGCDGKTYSNRCEAAAHGQNVQYMRACE